MKKIYITIVSLILIIFILITFIKLQSSPKAVKQPDVQYPAIEKEKIQAFWKIYRLANAQRIAGQLNKAVNGYKNALRYDEKHEDTLYYLGNVYVDLGEYHKAENYWKKLIEINARSTRAYFQLGNLYLNYSEENYFDIYKAEQYFQEVLNINKEESGSIYHLGQIELIRGNYKKARQIFDALSSTDYKNLHASFLNGYIDWKKGNPELAILRFTRSLQPSESPGLAKDISAEGDTKSGKPLYSSVSSKRKSLFYDYTHGLSELKTPLDPIQFEKRFIRLNEYLIQLRAKI